MDKAPSIDEQRAYYDRWNTAYRQREFEEIPEEIRSRSAKILEILEALALRSPAILEVGCGTGWLSEKLCAFGRVTAIDLSPAAIAVARSRELPAHFIDADFYEHDFRDARFDVAVCAESLFYVADQPRFIRKLASLLRDGAPLLVSAINKFAYDRSSDVPPPEPGQIRNWLTRGQLNRLLSRHFDVVSTWTVEPRGDRGVLRLVNSHKVNSVLGVLMSPERVKRAKERLGLGGGVVVLSRKKATALPGWSVSPDR